MELITILSDNDQASYRHWCGNDEAGHFTHHNRMPVTPDLATIRLSWKANNSSPEQYIGTFCLHLSSLVEAGFIKEESDGKVRVKFVNDNGVIKLSPGLRLPGIILGVRNER